LYHREDELNRGEEDFFVNPFRLEAVTVAFQTPDGIHTALASVSVDIGPGEWLAVVGRNGSGKSTLGRVAAGLCPISEGTIRAGWLSESGVRMVQQNPEAQIVGETAEEDLWFAVERDAGTVEEKRARIRSALREVGMEHLSAMPVSRLSGGQKQLLSVAGCLASGARMIVFDEAGSMLDPAARLRLLRTADAIRRSGAAVIWITQSMDELAPADRVIALDRGRIVYEGDSFGFFYGGEGEELSPCERLGLLPPFAVRVAQSLRKAGVPLRLLPLTPEQLAEAVAYGCGHSS
jgi:energy-coupling factor transport system ATP-binding protein